MAYHYKVSDNINEDVSTFEGIQVHEGDILPTTGPCIKYDFSKHVLIELLDNVTPEAKLWEELGFNRNKSVVHKRLLVDPHRVNCRRAIIVCTSPDEANEVARRLTQAKIIKRCVCAVVIQDLLSDICLFEKEIMGYGDQGSQQQLVYVTDLNRRREPTGLVQYLRDKFSPFGTILSIFVSEDKDGYAFPEGIIRFAHLSEAFAAELAYDQCAVAMERLSVTTHHNILLSQCDLKTRLKEARLRHSNETFPDSNETDSDSNKTGSNSPKVSSTEKNNSKSSLSSVRTRSSSSSVTSEKSQNKRSNRQKDPELEDISPIQEQVEIPTDSAELADVLEKPCNDNLVDCLKGITMMSDCSVSKATSVTSISSSSEVNDQNRVDPQCSSPTESTLNATKLNQSWSSRILGWITEIPSVDDMHRYNDLPSNDIWNRNLSSGSGDQHRSEIREDDKNHNVDMQHPEPINLPDIASNSGSFVTCRNGNQTASYNSFPSSPVSTVISETSNHNLTLQANLHSSSERSMHSTADSDVEDNDRIKTLLSVGNSDICPVSSSQKRKNSSLMTQKLSLKSQRLDSSQAMEVSDSEITIRLPSSSCKRQCSVVLNSVPELNELARNFAGFKTPIIITPERLDILQPQRLKRNARLPVSPKSFRRRTGSVVSESSEVASSIKTTVSLPVRRSSRLATLEDYPKSSTEQPPMDVAENIGVPSIIHRQKNKLPNGKEKESPLRVWLKKELMSSTNNQNQKSDATANKDMLVSIGCSHMTCDFCYPDSTELLLGSH